MFATDLISFTKEGIYCPKGDFWIDPTRKKNIAVITHAHSDHARRGMGEYIAESSTAKLLKLFFGNETNVRSVEYGNPLTINGVKITLFPSAHVLGASQILIEYSGTKVIVAGDYKVEDDNISGNFEHVECDIFVTESTFAKPRYLWREQKHIFDEMNTWWKKNQNEGTISVLQAYSLGKAQRLLRNIDRKIGTIFTAPQIESINEIYRAAGKDLPETIILDSKIDPEYLEGSLIVTPSQKVFEELNIPFPLRVKRVSGWMLDNWFGSDGFVLSDHADWDGLNKAVTVSKAERVYVQHGFTAYYTKYLKSQGLDAHDVKDAIKRGSEFELF